MGTSLLRKTGESQYDVLIDEQTIGQVWNWHGSWSAQVRGKTYYGLKSRVGSLLIAGCSEVEPSPSRAHQRLGGFSQRGSCIADAHGSITVQLAVMRRVSGRVLVVLVVLLPG